MKLKFAILFILFFCNISFSFSQEFSKDEKMFFDDFKKDSINIDLIKGLLLIDSLYTKKSYLKTKIILDNFITTLPKEQKSDKKEKKRIKKIYDLIHKKFFSKYDEKVFFNDIFTSKTYNCVTATALYVYVFDKIKVPYHIKELPSHVFLIAYPNKYKIHLETTVPGSYGFYTPKDSEVVNIVKELIKTKQLTKEEVNEKGYNKSYLEYFYGKEHVNKSTLIGMQYYNKTLFNLQDKNIEDAFNNINKSFVFYKNPYSKALLLEIIKQGTQKLAFNNLVFIKMLFDTVQLLEYKTEISENSIKLILYKIVTDDNNDLESIENFIPFFESLNNNELKKFCVYYLNEYLAENNLQKNNFKKSLQFSEFLYKKDNNNKYVKEMIAFALVKTHYLLMVNEDTIKSLNNYIVKYPFLDDDKRVITLLASFYATLTHNYYSSRNEEEAYFNFKKFDEYLTLKKDLLQINPELVAGLYVQAGKYYYGSNKFKKAKEIFEKGLKIYPKHPELNKKLKWTIEDMNLE